MRTAYLDCFSGISGDMFLGALLDAGVSPKLLEDTVAALDIGARLEISQVTRGGISGTKVDVYANGEKDLPREVFLRQQKRGQEQDQDHVHPHSHKPHDRQLVHYHARTQPQIRGIIEKAAISSTAKATAVRIFEALG
jgi:pyridinium-3,5-bisthiocarboxylic acid mononucleotide nickel chelatase